MPRSGRDDRICRYFFKLGLGMGLIASGDDVVFGDLVFDSMLMVALDNISNILGIGSIDISKRQCRLW